MRWRPDLSRLKAVHVLATVAALSVAVAVVLIAVSSGAESPVKRAARAHPAHSAPPRAVMHVHAVDPTVGGGAAKPRRQANAPRASLAKGPSLAKSVGQLIVGRFAGTRPTSSILAAVRAGEVGGIILFGDNTAGGPSATAALVSQLQQAAHAGRNPGLLIMTDQEGGLVKRLPGPPEMAASQMSNPTVAAQQGSATAQLLQSAGINVDLAPVADVTRVDGFMTQERRTFGSRPGVVARAACAFANALSSGGVAYTLKHFPGLGDAYSSTDAGPVTVTESASQLSADQAAYRRCGAGSRALVMVSSASYTSLTGSTPAVLSPSTYDALRADGANAVTISDDFETRAISGQLTPARRAINAGLDLVLYAETETASEQAYQELYRDAQDSTLSPTRVRAAAAAVLALKRSLNLS